MFAMKLSMERRTSKFWTSTFESLWTQRWNPLFWTAMQFSRLYLKTSETSSALLSTQHGFKKCRKVYYRIFDTVSEIHSWIYVFVEVLVVSMISASASTLTFWQSSLFSKFEGSILVLEETETGFPFMLTEFFCNALKAISALAMALRVCVCCICNCNYKKNRQILKWRQSRNKHLVSQKIRDGWNSLYPIQHCIFEFYRETKTCIARF